MIFTAVVLLALTGAGGLVIAGIRFSGRPYPPPWLAMTQGLLASSGLALLLFAALTAGVSRFIGAGLLLLLAAAVGGLVMNLAFHWRERPLPVWLVLVHAAVALSGVVLVALSLL